MTDQACERAERVDVTRLLPVGERPPIALSGRPLDGSLGAVRG